MPYTADYDEWMKKGRRAFNLNDPHTPPPPGPPKIKKPKAKPKKKKK